MPDDQMFTSGRKQEIVSLYLQHLDRHLQQLKAGKAERALEIQDLAELLFIHPRHLSNTIREVLGKSPCDVYEEKLLAIAKELLLASDASVAHIAHTLTFDPSNFNKFFKSYEGMTPGQFRALTKYTKNTAGKN